MKNPEFVYHKIWTQNDWKSQLIPLLIWLILLSSMLHNRTI